jgi:uncharacterized protein YndB with AHSA1/START domain
MASAPKIKTGFFVVADISGYTSFLSGTELEHAQAIVEELTKLILTHINPPLKIIKLEGDAVFYYAPGEMLPESERLLDHIEACYFDFVNHVRHMQHITNCTCRACASMNTLDLKFFAHHGEYMIQKVPGTADDIAGRDVILLHRLLKNTVTEKMGFRGYALLTNALLELIAKPKSFVPHTETYEYLGEVQCGVYDLRAAEQKMREATRVYLEPQDADYIYERILPAPPELLWSFIVDPQRRLQWQAIKGVKNVRNNSGRMGVDAEFHCNHGTFSRITRMMDWRPFHYMTNTTVQAFHKVGWKAPPMFITFEFIPVDEGRTKLSLRSRSLRRDWFTMFVVRLFMKRLLDKENNAEFSKLEKILQQLGKQTN